MTTLSDKKVGSLRAGIPLALPVHNSPTISALFFGWDDNHSCHTLRITTYTGLEKKY